MSVAQFASLIGVHPRSVSNHAASGAVPQTYAAIAVLMGDAADRAIDFKEALERFGLRMIKGRADGRNVRHIDDYVRARRTRSDGR